jgi:hypothetical protein
MDAAAKTKQGAPLTGEVRVQPGGVPEVQLPEMPEEALEELLERVVGPAVAQELFRLVHAEDSVNCDTEDTEKRLTEPKGLG